MFCFLFPFHTVAAWLGLFATRTVNCLCCVFFSFLHTVTVAGAVGNENCQLHALCPLFLSSLCCCIARAVCNKGCQLPVFCPLFLSALGLLTMYGVNYLCSVLSLFLHVVAAIVSPVGNTGCPLPGLSRAVCNKGCQLPVFCPLFLSALGLLTMYGVNYLCSVLSLFLHVIAAIVSPVGNTGCPLPGLCPLFVSSHCCCMARPVGNKGFQLPVFYLLFLFFLSHCSCC